MTKIAVAALACLVPLAYGTVWDIELTGPAGAGLRGGNEVPPNASPARGGELSDFGGAGLTYDDVANTFNINIGYGSDIGYSGGDLTGDYTLAHIHGPGSVAQTAPPIVDLTSYNNPAPGNNLRTGTLTGVTPAITETEEGYLFSGLMYLNIHSTAFPGGEIRGQLTPVPEPRAYAVMGGLALLAFAGVRRFRTARVA